jgi:hypothetical protein
MKLALKPFAGLAVLICLAAAISAGASAETEPIASRTSQVNGVELHYLTAGHGPAVILLHGYTQTSRMWRPIIPLLAA